MISRWLDKLWQPTMKMQEDVGCLLAVTSLFGVITLGCMAIYILLAILSLVLASFGFCPTN